MCVCVCVHVCMCVCYRNGGCMENRVLSALLTTRSVQFLHSRSIATALNTVLVTALNRNTISYAFFLCLLICACVIHWCVIWWWFTVRWIRAIVGKLKLKCNQHMVFSMESNCALQVDIDMDIECSWQPSQKKTTTENTTPPKKQQQKKHQTSHMSSILL